MAGFFDRLARGLSDRAPAQALGRRPALPAFSTGAKVSLPFGVSSLTKQRDSVADLATVVAAYRVPKETMLTVQRAKPFRLYLGAVYEETLAVPVGLAGDFVYTLPNGLAQSTRTAPAFPTEAHPDVRGYAYTGAAWESRPVAAVDFATGDVTLTLELNDEAVRIHHLPVKGEVELRVIRPNGGAVDVASRQWNASLLTLAATDQDAGETALRFSGLQPTFSLPPEWSLGVVVRGPDTIDWDSPLTEFYADAYTQRIAVRDQQALYAMAERSLRG